MPRAPSNAGGALSNIPCTAIRRQGMRGFTLLEVLVALTIFAILSLITYRGVNMLVDTRTAVIDETRYWRELTLAFERIEADLAQLAPRPWRDAAASWQLPLQSVEAVANTPGVGLEFVRFDAQRAPLHGVYQCQGDRLLLWLYPRPDVVREDVPRRYTMLSNLTRCEWAYLDAQNQWQSSWRSASKPRAIRVRLGLAQRAGDYERIFLVP
ncbi:type II secretion system minor pseudopilin GspJ [Chitinibacter tainanensis]|uniref:type II secretion system minor pseudopilin GspJ n=1 Tax=Chitinibacter tainanensis TaxID=230667 RepID=UPI002357D4F6|nr:type II secretion system minor pseudopilin GspJ [Chitinibacter tainanensis]